MRFLPVAWFSWLRSLWEPQGPSAAPSPRRAPASGGSAQRRRSDSTEVPAASGTLRLTYGVESTTGNHREINEDNYFVPGRPSINAAAIAKNGDPGVGSVDRDGSTVVLTPPPGLAGLFVVADGMGGQQAGEKASLMAVELIPREVSHRLAPAVEDEAAVTAGLRKSVAAANEQILALSTLDAETQHMGTTVVLAFFRGSNAFVAGIGDSRGYRLRDGRLEQLTRDHSLARALQEAGTIKPEDVETHKFNHVLYNYLGSRDARDGPEQVRVLELRPGDRFLLASDGLTGVVKDDEIATLLASEPDPQAAAAILVDRALANLSKDNVTCLVIHVDRPS